MIERPIQLVDRVRSEGVEHVRSVEGDPHRAARGTREHAPVIRDVGEVETGDWLPRGGVEVRRDEGRAPVLTPEGYVLTRAPSLP